MLKFQLCISRINNILKYIQTKKSHFKFIIFNISHYYCLFWIFYQINAALVNIISIGNLFGKSQHSSFRLCIRLGVVATLSKSFEKNWVWSQSCLLASLSLSLSLSHSYFFPQSPPHVLETEILDQGQRKGGNGWKRNQTVTEEHIQETKKRQDNRNTFFLTPAFLPLAPCLVSLS